MFLFFFFFPRLFFAPCISLRLFFTLGRQRVSGGIHYKWFAVLPTPVAPQTANGRIRPPVAGTVSLRDHCPSAALSRPRTVWTVSSMTPPPRDVTYLRTAAVQVVHRCASSEGRRRPWWSRTRQVLARGRKGKRLRGKPTIIESKVAKVRRGPVQLFSKNVKTS